MGETEEREMVDLFVAGGGVNGCAIARDAAGRGQSVVLAEQGDLASATSSASSKLIHGGLRYLETYEFKLVREALRERAVLLAALPHIAWPMRFVLPHHTGLRPRWMLRAGLFLYDHLASRGGLPASRAVNLTTHPAGRLLKSSFTSGFEYSDGWVDDSRLVVLNARDARERGAEILTRAKVTSARRHADHWEIEIDRGGVLEIRRARMLVNAAGPWAGLLSEHIGPRHGLRLVRGSHIVVPRLEGHDQPYILQGHDGRIVFLIPFEEDFTLIGTTEAEHGADPASAECSEAETEYLIAFVNDYLAKPVTKSDIVWSFSGVRPLIESGGDATSASRDYQLVRDDKGGAPLLTVLGGKITAYRILAEQALDKLGVPGAWTAGAALPGGDFDRAEKPAMVKALVADYPFLTETWARRLVTAYGTDARRILGAAKSTQDLGGDFGATLTAAEVHHMMVHEFARTAEDIVWRRSKLGLKLSEDEIAGLAAWLAGKDRS
ncbi:glycerol-3-phosphate dehydrogenase [Maritimibacter sp. HL-12]|uniref:glycerol-3-phosphate dehydrogenase n=1 Tax=Maritimibacter sp. HL-12 TaxID=1162418 RepID=UPI000A0F2CF7|nr:glycerol-3-phosphate dehydrogenase [Maritimibacter sp. HL-12]SMH33460.1 homodimeric glycerol 3-phosphate dehydrogenase (quinone) [Maritimibacter sp. HL-12]